MRFVFYVPATRVPRGGISVILEVIDVLNANGFDAIALYDRPDFEYSRHTVKAPRLWSSAVRKPADGSWVRKMAKAARDLGLKQNQRPAGNTAPCQEWHAQPRDVVIVPEYVSHWMPKTLPEGPPLALFNQNPYALARVFAAPGFQSDRFTWSLASSEACAAGSRMCLQAEPILLPLYISSDLYAFEPDKAFQVAYMPRKRARDVGPLIKALQATPGFEDVPFIPIDGVSTEEAARLLRRSLFFLSLSEREGFGLPAAEAMATGALTIGYTGIGGDEFFTHETGYPVPEDNLAALYETAVAVITGYKSDSAPFEILRKRASEIILQAYPRDKFEAAVIDVFGQMRRQVTAEGP